MQPDTLERGQPLAGARMGRQDDREAVALGELR